MNQFDRDQELQALRHEVHVSALKVLTSWLERTPGEVVSTDERDVFDSRVLTLADALRAKPTCYSCGQEIADDA